MKNFTIGSIRAGVLTLFTFCIALVAVTSCVDDEGGEIPVVLDVVSSTNRLTFDTTIIDTSAITSYQVAVSELENNLEVTLVDPGNAFAISKTIDEGFSDALTFSPSEFTDGAGLTTIFVLFDPEMAGDFQGSILHTTSGLVNEAVVAVEATGIFDPEKVPNISTDLPSLSFDPLLLGETTVQSYELSAAKLAGDLNLSISDASAPFALSKDMAGPFSTGISFTSADFANGSATVYVQFAPESEGVFDAAVEHRTNGLPTVPTVGLTGQGSSDPPVLLMVDNFDYPAGIFPSTDRTNDGTLNDDLEGWLKVRTGNTPVMIAIEGLQYQNYSGSGIGNSVLLDFDLPGSNSNVYAYNLSEQQDASFTGSYYSSFIFRIDNLPDGAFNRPVMFVAWNANGTTRFLSALQVNYNEGSHKFGVMYEGEAVVSDVNAVAGQTYLVVLKHTVPDTDITNANNTAEIFIFSNGNIPASEPASSDAVIMSGATGDDQFVQAITVVSDNNPAGRYLVDGLKVANTWEDLFK